VFVCVTLLGYNDINIHVPSMHTQCYKPEGEKIQYNNNYFSDMSTVLSTGQEYCQKTALHAMIPQDIRSLITQDLWG
jgi:hypothetical protein